MVVMKLNGKYKRIIIERITSNGIRNVITYEPDGQRSKTEHLYKEERERDEVKIISSSVKKYFNPTGVEALTGIDKENFLKKAEADFPILHLR